MVGSMPLLWETQMKLLAPGVGLVQPWLSQLFVEFTSDNHALLSVVLPFKLKKEKLLSQNSGMQKILSETSFRLFE